MVKFGRAGAIFLTAAAWACSSAAALAQEYFDPKQEMTTELWREDIATLVEELEVRHAAPYPDISPAEFRKKAEQLKARLPGLSDDEVVLEIGRLTALVGEGHTGVQPFDQGIDDRRLPIELMRDDQGFFTFATSPEYAGLVGSRLLAIGGTPVGEVEAKMQPLMPADNEYTRRKLIVDYLRVAGMLQALEVVAEADAVPITIRRPGGEEEKVVLRPIPKGSEDEIDWRFAQPADELPLWLRNRDQKYWSVHLPDRDAVYVQFNSADIGRGEPEQRFIAFNDQLVRLIEQQEVDRLIIDLRWNTGGSLPRALHLMHAILRAERVNQSGRTFILINNRSFSAASSLATFIGRHTNALFVGEPTGGKPSSFGDLRRLRLPNSGLTVRYAAHRSSAYSGTDLRPAVFPDLRASLSLKEYLAGVDPWLQAVWNYSPRTPIGTHLEQLLAASGIEAARAEFRRAWSEDYNRFEFDAGELNRLGYALLGQEKVDEAIAIFELNVETYPWQAYIYDSLADGYFAAGRDAEAMEMLRRTYDLDRAYPRWRDLLLEQRSAE